MPLTYAEEILQRQLQPLHEAANRFADRQAKLEDVASARDFEESAAQRASARRMKEFEEQERQRLIQKLAEKGVPVKQSDSVEEANGKNRQFEQNRAGNMLENFTGQLTEVANQKQQTISNLQRLATKQADPATQREALIVTLANPAAAKDIPSEQLAKLKAVLNGPGDPAKVVQKVYDYMQNDYWFRKGAAQNKASAFYQTYLTELNSRLDKSKQIDAALEMNKLNDLDKAGQDIIHQRDLHIAGSSGFLTKDQIKNSHEAHPIAPPQNPADAFKDLGAPGEMQGPPVPAAPPSVPTAGSPPPQPPGMAERMIMGAGDAVSNMAGNTAAYFTSPGGGPPPVARDFLGMGGREDYVPAPSAADVQANRNRIDSQAVIPPPADPTAAAAEEKAVRQMAMGMGATQQELDQAAKAIQSGAATPDLIKKHNALVKMVRAQSGNMGAMPTNAPALGAQ